MIRNTSVFITPLGSPVANGSPYSQRAIARAMKIEPNNHAATKTIAKTQNKNLLSGTFRQGGAG